MEGQKRSRGGRVSKEGREGRGRGRGRAIREGGREGGREKGQ